MSKKTHKSLGAAEHQKAAARSQIGNRADIAPKPVSGSYAGRVAMDPSGRLVVPAKIRKALGLEGSQELTIRLEGGVIRLQTLTAAIEKAQALVRRRRTRQGSMVDELIAERRAEAAKE